MTDVIRSSQLRVAVSLTAEAVAVELRDRRSESIGMFDDLDEAQREQLALDAWTVGLRALHNAHTAAQGSRLHEVGESLLADIDRQLRTHIEQQQVTIGAVLARFFDPSDGQVSQRLAAFVDDHGVLARMLDRYLGPQNSVLAEALARQVGETSPLFKKLSPTDSHGLVKVLETQLRTVMGESHAELVRALDPLAEDGAVARFLRSLREELKGAEEDRHKQLSAALAALDANDDGSLLSRLVRETHQARQDVLAAANPDSPSSPMAILKASLTKLLQEQAVDGISDEIRKAQKALDRLLRKAQSALRALNIEASDESIEVGSPIELPNDSFSNAVHTLPSGGEAA